jgi:hypothetical protein
MNRYKIAANLIWFSVPVLAIALAYGIFQVIVGNVSVGLVIALSVITTLLGVLRLYAKLTDGTPL